MNKLMSVLSFNICQSVSLWLQFKEEQIFWIVMKHIWSSLELWPVIWDKKSNINAATSNTFSCFFLIPTTTMLTILIFTIAVTAQADDICREMTVADCEIGEDNIVDRLPFTASICEKSCKLSDNCRFWRAYHNDSMKLPECLHIRTNYKKVRWRDWGVCGRGWKTALF